MERLRAGESLAHDDAHRDGVSPPVRATRPAAGLRPHSAVWLSRQHVSHRASRARSAPPPTTRATLDDVFDTARMALSALRSADGPRPDHLQAPADRRHTRLRHLMSLQPRHRDRRLRQRGRSRVSRSVPRCMVAARHIRRCSRTRDGRRAGRRRSRGDGSSIDDASRSTIPIPAP